MANKMKQAKQAVPNNPKIAKKMGMKAMPMTKVAAKKAKC